MKTYLPQVEPRIIIRPNISFGILNYDNDNAYPQRMLELVGQSPTASDCWEKRAKFIGGAGFEDEKIGDTVLNNRGLTLNKLRIAIAADKGLFRGFGIHVNYNANLKPVSYNYVPFEDIRMGNVDDKKYGGKFALYPDWGRRSWRNIYMSKITILDPFTSNPEKIKEQIFNAGGFDLWKGQLYYFNPAIDTYPLIKADSVWEDFETEAGIKVFNNREVTTGFLPSTILTIASRREEADNQGPAPGGEYFNKPSQFERDLGDFQGTKKAQKIIVLEYDEGTTPPEFHPYQIQNNDKLFEVTEKSVEARIIKGFSVPNALVTSDKKAGLSDSGFDKREAIREFNDNTAPERTEIAQVFDMIFAGFSGFRGNKASQNFTILGIPNDIAEDVVGMKAGVAINGLLLSNYPADQKRAVLIYVYGFKPSEAEEMVPDVMPTQVVVPTSDQTGQSQQDQQTKNEEGK